MNPIADSSSARSAILGRLQNTRAGSTTKAALTPRPPRTIEAPETEFIAQAKAAGSEVYTAKDALEAEQIIEDLSQSQGCHIAEAQLAIAETGSVVINSQQQANRDLFLAEHLIVLVQQDQLVTYLHEALNQCCDTQRRSVNIITGPSRTADVEQTIQIGAHGPKALSIVLIR